MPRKAVLQPVSREQLLSAAQELMLAKGFTATSVDEICQAADLSKGTFFHYFSSKEDLGTQLLDYYIDGWMKTIFTASFEKEKDPLKRVYNCIDFFFRRSMDTRFPASCLLGNLAQELSHTHSAVRSRCCEHFLKWSTALEEELKAAKKKYRPKSKINTRSLADHFIVVFEGAVLFAKTSGPKRARALQESLRHYKHYLKMLFED